MLPTRDRHFRAAMDYARPCAMRHKSNTQYAACFITCATARSAGAPRAPFREYWATSHAADAEIGRRLAAQRDIARRLAVIAAIDTHHYERKQPLRISRQCRRPRKARHATPTAKFLVTGDIRHSTPFPAMRAAMPLPFNLFTPRLFT